MQPRIVGILPAEPSRDRQAGGPNDEFVTVSRVVTGVEYKGTLDNVSHSDLIIGFGSTKKTQNDEGLCSNLGRDESLEMESVS